jgi:N-acetylglucosaminyldiphosphoundecaprenol N-acetyl-beta-D-mannosaminyltransferase
MVQLSGGRSSNDVERVDILGCPFDAVAFDEVLALVERAILEKRRIQIVPGNVDFVMKARRSRQFQHLLRQMDLVIADGVPVIWAATMLGTPLRRRVSGTDLTWRCGEISAKLEVPVAMIGAAPGVAQRAADRMTAAFPGARIHAVSTPMTLGAAENQELVSCVRQLGAKIVLVALGAPRQEVWVRDHLEACDAFVGIGIGSAFDIISGDQPRAPPWMADNGLEWLHRLLLEPRRLGRRYLLEDSPFMLHLAKELIMRRLQQSAS